MARPKSEDKRLALIDAATWAVSEFGLGASTALIAKKAGVAEGTLFRYFATKDVLFTEMYLYKKKALGEILIKNHDVNQSIYLRSRQVWNNYIEWGLVNPDAHKALRQLTVSGRIGEDIENEAMDYFPDLQALCRAKLKGDLQPAEEDVFAGAIFYALAETTMDFAKNNPDRKQEFISSGFDVMWLGMMQDLPGTCQ